MSIGTFYALLTVLALIYISTDLYQASFSQTEM